MSERATLSPARLRDELAWWEGRKWGDQTLRLHAEAVTAILRRAAAGEGTGDHRAGGLCTVVAVDEMQVITYAFETYEIALAQAIELHKGVTGTEDLGETMQNGLRRHTYVTRWAQQLVQVQEVEVGSAIMEVK